MDIRKIESSIERVTDTRKEIEKLNDVVASLRFAIEDLYKEKQNRIINRSYNVSLWRNHELMLDTVELIDIYTIKIDRYQKKISELREIYISQLQYLIKNND